MAARVEEQREDHPQPTSTTTRTSSTAAPARADGDVREVSLTEFRFKFPGLVSMGEG